MRKLLAIGLLLACSSCYKDEVDVSTLHTNPLDPDYTGASFITISGENTYSPSAGVFNQEFHVHVNSSVFPSSVPYALHVVNTGNGDYVDLQQSAPGNDDFLYTNFNVTLGQQYCYAVSVRIQLSDTRAENFCAVAEL